MCHGTETFVNLDRNTVFSRAQHFEMKKKKLIFIICMHLCNAPYHLPLFLCNRALWVSCCQWFVGISQVWQTPFYF